MILRLTHADAHHADHPRVFVNFNLVARYWREDDYTLIRFADGSIQFVDETPAEIADLLSGGVG